MLVAPSLNSALFRADEPWTEEHWKDIKPDGIRVHPALAEMSTYIEYYPPPDDSDGDALILVVPLLPTANTIIGPHRSTPAKRHVKQTSIYMESATWPPVNTVSFKHLCPGEDYVTYEGHYVVTVDNFLKTLPGYILYCYGRFYCDAHVIGWKAKRIIMTAGTPGIELAARLGRRVGARSYIEESAIDKYEYLDLLEGYPEYENPKGDKHRMEAEAWTRNWRY